MSGIKLNLKNTGISQKSIMEYKEQVENIHKEVVCLFDNLTGNDI